MRVSLVVGKSPTHLLKKVSCNAKQYLVPFPLYHHDYIKIVDLLYISADYQDTIEILSGQKKEVNSVESFYKAQKQSQQYFGVNVQMNHLSFTLNLLSNTDINISQLDHLTLKDLFAIFKQGFDGLASQMHSKIQRRFKKYLCETKRTRQQRQEIEKYVMFLKSESTDQQLEIQQQEQEKESQVVKEKKKQTKLSNDKEYLSELEQKKQVYAHHKHQKKHHHHGQRKSQDEEADWEDIEEEKLNKKLLKKLKKKDILQQDQQIEQENIKIKKDKKQFPDRHIFANFKEKNEKSSKVYLGIFGDTEQGWRERYRVGRVAF